MLVGAISTDEAVEGYVQTFGQSVEHLVDGPQHGARCQQDRRE